MCGYIYWPTSVSYTHLIFEVKYSPMADLFLRYSNCPFRDVIYCVFRGKIYAVCFTVIDCHILAAIKIFLLFNVQLCRYAVFFHNFIAIMF